MNPAVRRTKYLTEAAAAAAIAALLVLLKLLAPFLVFVTMIAAAVPIAIICDFHGMKWGLGTCVAEVLIVNMFGGPEIGLTTAFMRRLSVLRWGMVSAISCRMQRR